MSDRPPLPAPVIVRGRVDPLWYLQRVYGLEFHDEWARKFIESVRDRAETAVRSGHGVGKSYTVGALCCWFLDCWESKVIGTAPVHRQALNTYRYFKNFRSRAVFDVPGTCLETPLCKVDDLWFASFFTAKDAGSFAGEHGRRVLLVLEEAGGIPPEIYEAAYGAATGEDDRIVHIGNPIAISGGFMQAFKDPDVRKFTVSCLDSVNVKSRKTVVQGLVSRRYVDRIGKRFGTDSDVYRVRVLGLPPRHNTISVVPLAWWEQAKIRGALFAGEEHPVAGRLRGGWDPSGGGDRQGWIVRDDVRVRAAEAWRGVSLTEGRERVAVWLRDHEEAVLAMDVGGLGLGPFEDLREEFGGRVVGVNFGGAQVSTDERDFMETAGSDERIPLYANRRGEIAHKASEWIRDHAEVPEGEIDRDEFQELEEDVLSPRWTHDGKTRKGQLQVEPKADTRKRLGRSPDLFDALALCVAADIEEDVACAGAATHQSPFESRLGPPPAYHDPFVGRDPDTWRSAR